MSKHEYECLIANCGKSFDSPRGIKLHLQKVHNVKKAVEAEHFKHVEKKKSQHWKAWQKYPDGSRKFRLIDGQWVKQQPGEYFREARSHKRSKRKPDKTPSVQIGIAGQPMFDNGYILLPVTLRIPFNLGIPQIIQDEQQTGE